ncbi:MAG TPA: DedA family protein [Beijerinckiaceae bacterium]|jgi:membrane protein DedA with SNARE-associated domain|nr:DedA family protein [Beijerinckiaceae bacterium]
MFLAYVQPLVAQYGLYAVFVIVMLESAGVPLPGETALVLASIYAGATGDLHIAQVIAAAAAGAIIGDNMGFWVGRHFGMPLLKRYGRFIHLDEKRLAFGEAMFRRHGAKIVFFGRFIAILRIFAALLAGVNRYGWGSFLFYNAAGGIVWATVFGLGGYFFGEAIHRFTGPVGLIALAGVILGIGVSWWVVRRQEARMEQRILAEEQEKQRWED